MHVNFKYPVFVKEQGYHYLFVTVHRRSLTFALAAVRTEHLEPVAWAENSRFLRRALTTRGHHYAATQNLTKTQAEVETPSPRWFYTKASWLAQTLTWHWVLTNGVSDDRELLLRHVSCWGIDGGMVVVVGCSNPYQQSCYTISLSRHASSLRLSLRPFLRPHTANSALTTANNLALGARCNCCEPRTPV